MNAVRYQMLQLTVFLSGRLKALLTVPCIFDYKSIKSSKVGVLLKYPAPVGFLVVVLQKKCINNLTKDSLKITFCLLEL